jgi:hypothetical protein
LSKCVLAFGIFFILLFTAITPFTVGYKIKTASNDTDYWALLIAVGVYEDHPEQDRPSMLREVDDLYNKLLVSSHWKETNIKVIKGENATFWNIFKGFQWLNQKEGKDDFSLIYISTHGGQLTRDMFPWDEKDKSDEVLVSYRGFKYPWTNIRDDLLNLLLSLLDSQGVCVVVDSCYAGGFNDPPYFKTGIRNRGINPKRWMVDFTEDLKGDGRVVLMSCEEDELSYAGIFSPLLIEALTGYADADEDRLVSAEESFVYIVENIDPLYEMHPIIYDGYAGDIQLTEVEFPPSKPVTPIGQKIGDTNTTYYYSTMSADPEGREISYGWDWDGDFVVDEWSDFFESNKTTNFSHTWNLEGIYNIRVMAKDEVGLYSDWSDYIDVIMCNDNIPDQWQRETDSGCWLDYGWIAQSFTPSLDTLSKVDIAIMSLGQGDPKPLHLSIRDNLTGNNLTESSLAIYDLGDGRWSWYTFDFEDIDIITGGTYYIVCKGRGDWSYKWKWKLGNPYVSGEAFWSSDGLEWHAFYPSYDADCCFVTWGKT